VKASAPYSDIIASQIAKYGYYVGKANKSLLHTLNSLVSNHIIANHTKFNIDFRLLPSNINLINYEDQSLLYETALAVLQPVSRTDRTISVEQVMAAKPYILKDFNSMGIPVTDLVLNDFYFRIVRDSITQEHSKIHRDAWFHKSLPSWINYGSTKNTLKFWMPLYAISSHILGVVPMSHLDSPDDFDITTATNEYAVFEPHKHLSYDNLTPVCTPIGTFILFPPNLLHGTLRPDRTKARLSCELTLLIDSSDTEYSKIFY